MSDVGIPSDSPHPQTQRIKVIRSRRPPPDPTHAFGFVLDHQCRRRWAKYYLEEADKEQPCTYSSEEYEDLIEGIMVAINTTIPSRVYHAIPDLPRVRRDLLPVDDNEFAYTRFVFALRDNSTSKNMHSPLTPEHIEAVRKELGLEEDQQPEWVRIARD